MICPICREPNPEGIEVCLSCTHPFVTPRIELTPAPEDSDASELTSVPTMGSPSSFKQWAANQSQRGTNSSVVLPAGLEIGNTTRLFVSIGYRVNF